jgi:hypothetical protein
MYYKHRSFGIFVDTDTFFFLKDPAVLFEKIRDGHTLMHLVEYPISKKPELILYFHASLSTMPADMYILSPHPLICGIPAYWDLARNTGF